MLAKLIGRILCKPAVYQFLHTAASFTPDEHIMSPDGKEVYMYRYWLFNKITNYKRKYWFIPFSIRVHSIVKPDLDRHTHDHPFNARTWIMRGGYDEVRREQLVWPGSSGDDFIGVFYKRRAGDTSTLGFEQFHKITKLEEGGALTLFMFGPYKGQWGFMVDGYKMLRAEYQRRYQAGSPGACKATQYGDQTLCHPCGLGWDTNDPDRPACDSEINPATRTM